MSFIKNLHLPSNILLIAVSLLSLNVSAGASSKGDFYTWVDKDGIVNYSDQPMMDADVLKVELSDNPNISDTVNPNSQWKQDYTKAQENKTAQAIKKSEDKIQKKLYCDNLKSDLAIYQQGGRIYTMSPSGERAYKSQDELTSKVKELTKKLKKNCR